MSLNILHQNTLYLTVTVFTKHPLTLCRFHCQGVADMVAFLWCSADTMWPPQWLRHTRRGPIRWAGVRGWDLLLCTVVPKQHIHHRQTSPLLSWCAELMNHQHKFHHVHFILIKQSCMLFFCVSRFPHSQDKWGVRTILFPHTCALCWEEEVGSKQRVGTAFYRKWVKFRAQLQSKWVRQILLHEETWIILKIEMCSNIVFPNSQISWAFFGSK